MTVPQDAVERATPPYMSFARLEGFIASLAGKPLPPRIDRTVLSKMSGGDQSQVRIALRFLGLALGDDYRVTEEFKALAGAFASPPTQQWKDALAVVISSSYAPLTAELDANATQGQLDDAFRKMSGLTGSSLVKAVRFYLGAAAAAGIPLSPHFKGTSTVSTSSSKPKKQRKVNVATNDAPRVDRAETPPADVDEIAVPIPGKSVRVWLPGNLTQSEFDFVLQTLKTWRKLKHSTS